MSLSANVAVGAYALYGEFRPGPKMKTVIHRWFDDIGTVDWQGNDRYMVLRIEDGDGDAAFRALGLMLRDLGFSDGTIDRMAMTRALDGLQSAEGDKVGVTWTYHPDDGLNMIFERQ